MKDIPVLFKPEMILEIDEDRKTQTRRLKFNASVGDRLWIKEPHSMWGKYRWTGGYTKTGKKKMQFCDMTCQEHPVIFSLEKNGMSYMDFAYGESIRYHPRSPLFMPKKYARKWLEVTGVRVERLQDISEADAIAEGVGKIFVEIPPTPQNDMGGDYRYYWKDYLNPGEYAGWGGDAGSFMTAKESFQSLWDSINADRTPWSSNPQVKVIEFKRIKP